MVISIIIPAYNEEEVIGDVLGEILSLQVADEIIVVNDGSSDNTASVVREFDEVTLLEHPYNIGNGAAVKTGIRNSAGDILILMDGDGQHPPSVIPELLRHIDRHEMVVGARGKGTESSWHRDLANWAFNKYASYIVGYTVEDLTSGFRIIRGDIVRDFVYLLPNGFSYPTTITIALFRSGYPVKYHPFASPRRIGQSKIRPLRDGIRFGMTVTRLAIFFVPLKIFIPTSLLLFIPGVSYIVIQLLLEARFSGLGGLLAILGFLVFLLGLIAEQIALLRLVHSGKA